MSGDLIVARFMKYIDATNATYWMYLQSDIDGADFSQNQAFLSAMI